MICNKCNRTRHFIAFDILIKSYFMPRTLHDNTSQ